MSAAISPMKTPELSRHTRLLAWSLLCAIAACTATHYGTLPVTSAVSAPPPAPEVYRLKPGDELEIRFFHTPEQNVTLPVRPDGYISLPLAYEIQAAGSTIEELRREITLRCSAELVNPEIAVILRSVSGYSVHVGGEVNKPGVLEL